MSASTFEHIGDRELNSIEERARSVAADQDFIVHARVDSLPLLADIRRLRQKRG